MQSKASILKLKIAGSHPTRKIAVFIIVFMWACTTPALFGQQDVHAALSPLANRKLAPAFQLVTEDGTKMRLSDYQGKVVLLNFGLPIVAAAYLRFHRL